MCEQNIRKSNEKRNCEICFVVLFSEKQACSTYGIQKKKKKKRNATMVLLKNIFSIFIPQIHPRVVRVLNYGVLYCFFFLIFVRF